MNSKQAWDWFTISGSVEAYLLYCGCLEREGQESEYSSPPTYK